MTAGHQYNVRMTWTHIISDPTLGGTVNVQMGRKITHINRPLTDEERQRANEIRAMAQNDFPPKPAVGQTLSPPGIPARLLEARKARGLTRYALGELAGVPSVAIRNIE